MAIVLGAGCYLNAVDAYSLSTLPPEGQGGYGAPGAPGAGACVNVGVSKGAGQYVMGGDRLVFTAWSSLAGLTVTLTGQQVTPDCKVTPFTLSVKPAATVAPSSFTLSLIEGMLTSLAVSASGATVQRGQTYVRASIGIFDGGAVKPYATLISDYVTSSFQPSFPPAALREATDGPGYHREFDTVTGSLGPSWYITQEPTRVWLVKNVSYSMDTDIAVAGNRVEELEATTGTALVWESEPSQVQVAGTSFYYHFSQGANNPGLTAGTSITGRLPETTKYRGNGSGGFGNNQIGFSSPTDTFSFTSAVVEEWLNI